MLTGAVVKIEATWDPTTPETEVKDADERVVHGVSEK